MYSKRVKIEIISPPPPSRCLPTPPYVGYSLPYPLNYLANHVVIPVSRYMFLHIGCSRVPIRDTFHFQALVTHGGVYIQYDIGKGNNQYKYIQYSLP